MTCAPPPRARSDAVALRSIRSFGRHGRVVTFAVAGVVVHDSDELVVVATAPGSGMRLRAGRGDGPNGRIVLPDDWDGRFEERAWSGDTVVRVHRWGDRWSVWRWHDGERWSDHWYGNLESPWRRSPVGYDSQDWALDVVAAGTPGDATWSVALKDEDELAWMVGRGVVTEAEAAAVRAAGRELIELARAARWPFDADWDAWLPDPSLAPIPMPPGWDELGPRS